MNGTGALNVKNLHSLKFVLFFYFLFIFYFFIHHPFSVPFFHTDIDCNKSMRIKDGSI